MTEEENKCCHMRDVENDVRPNALEQWRREFRELARSEKCRDCPAAEKVS